MPDQPEEKQSDPLARIAHAIEELPTELAYKFRKERRIEREQDDARARTGDNREFARERTTARNRKLLKGRSEPSSPRPGEITSAGGGKSSARMRSTSARDNSRSSRSRYPGLA
jgi:hypothetical protein